MFRRKKRIKQTAGSAGPDHGLGDLLNSSNPLYKTIFDSMLDGVVVQDQNGKIIASNHAAQQILHLPNDELKGKSSLSPIWQNIHEDGSDFPGETHPAMEALKTGKSVKNIVMGLRTTDIKTKWLRVNAWPVIQNNTVAYVVATFIDISEEKRQLTEITDLKDRFMFATQSAKIGVWEWDLGTNAVIWDEQMYSLYGIASKDFNGAFDAWTKGLHKDDRKRSKAEIDKAIIEGKIFNSSFRVAWPNGSIRYIRAYGKPIKDSIGKVIKMVGVNWDVTDDVENIKSIERFKLAVEAAYDHVIICDHNGKIVYANNSAARTTGYSKEEMLGNTPRLWGGQMPKEFYQDMWHTISELKQPFIGEVNNIRKGGELYIAEAHISPILDETGTNVEFYLGIERDITLLKEIDKSKTEFVSLASHQLRTPLSAVNWYAELLQDEATGKLNDDQKSYVNEIYTGNQRMVALVNALLNISRLELGTFEISPKMTNPKKIVNDVLKELELQIKQNHLTLIDKSKKPITKYSADPELLLILVQNLLSNAVKYTPSNGTVTYSIDITGDKLFFTVSDTGRGIPAHQKDKIFTKLFRADNVRELEVEGTGLGLYIVKSIVEQSGGSISFTSQLNKGTTFVIELPKSGMQKKQGSKSLN